MSRDLIYMCDILEAAKLAVSYLTGRTDEEFLADTQCQDAVIRRIEIIGEAARRVSEQIRALYSDVHWRVMIHMRNLLIHDYDDVDLVIVRETV
jgi:uncharacterized protein with HEPN domain